MADDLTLGARGYAPAREISTAALLGQVLFLVAVAIGFLAVGRPIGRDLSQGAALAFSLGGFGMLISPRSAARGSASAPSPWAGCLPPRS